MLPGGSGPRAESERFARGTEKVIQAQEAKGVKKAQQGQLTPSRGSWQQAPDDGLVQGNGGKHT